MVSCCLARTRRASLCSTQPTSTLNRCFLLASRNQQSPQPQVDGHEEEGMFTIANAHAGNWTAMDAAFKAGRPYPNPQPHTPAQTPPTQPRTSPARAPAPSDCRARAQRPRPRPRADHGSLLGDDDDDHHRLRRHRRVDVRGEDYGRSRNGICPACCAPARIRRANPQLFGLTAQRSGRRNPRGGGRHRRLLPRRSALRAPNHVTSPVPTAGECLTAAGTWARSG